MVLEMSEMSKTYQYRKVMKPMLERKRRARINKCLDEMKDIMVEYLTQEGEHITRLEKADILELTVEYLKKMRAQKQLRLANGVVGGAAGAVGQDPKATIAESFRAGYVHAANEVSKTLASVPGVSVDLGTQLMSHLGHRLNYLQVVVPTISGLAAQQQSPMQQQTQLLSPTLNGAVYLGASPSPTSSSPSSLSSLSSPRSSVESRSPVVITPPPSECGSSDSGTCSPAPSESNTMWRPW